MSDLLRERRDGNAGDPLALEKDLMALAQSIPGTEWEKLPKDFNENLDHYLYGSPKRTSTKRMRA